MKKRKFASRDYGPLGCQNATKHGQYKTRTYRIWKWMRERCNSPRAAGYRFYGGRGIKVCKAWGSFATFLRDMGEAPAGMTIDRRNSDGNYEPGNCRWATRQQQNRNRKKTTKPRSSAFKGVSREGHKWRAGFRVNGKSIHVGTFGSEIEAAEAYDRAVIRHFGDFARPNFTKDAKDAPGPED